MLSVTACAHRFEPDPSPTELSDVQKQYVIDYTNETKLIQFPLPDGYDYPAEVPHDLGSVTPTAPNESNAGGAPAVEYWFCAWSDEYFTSVRDHDDAAAGAALDALDHWAEIDYVQKWWDDPDLVSRELVAAARQGDPSPLQDLSGDCPRMLLYK